MHKDKALLTSNHAIDIILEICHHPNIFKGEIREVVKSIDSKLNGRVNKQAWNLKWEATWWDVSDLPTWNQWTIFSTTKFPLEKEHIHPKIQ